MALSYAVSQKLVLIIEKCLQFLNALSFGSKNAAMSSIRQSKQILNSVIITNAIKVMNRPSFWQKLIIGLLPYKSMLLHISTSISPGIIRNFYFCISAGVYYSFAYITLTPLQIARSTPFRLTWYSCATVLAMVRSHIVIFRSCWLHPFLSSVRTALPFGGMVIFLLNCQSVLFSTRWAKLFEWCVIRKCHPAILANSYEYHTPILYYLDKSVKRGVTQC